MENLEVWYLLAKWKKEDILKNEDVSLWYFLSKWKLDAIISDKYTGTVFNVSERIFSLLSNKNAVITKKDEIYIASVNEIDTNTLSEKQKNTIVYLKSQLLLCMGRLPSILDIKTEVAEYFKMPVKTLDRKTRQRKIVQPRQIAMFFAVWMKLGSLSEVGGEIWWKDHATVLHAQKTINNLLEKDKSTIKEVQGIIRRLYKKWYFNIDAFKHEATRNNIIKLIQAPFKFV